MISPNCAHFVQTCDVFFAHLIPWGSRVACPSVLCEKMSDYLLIFSKDCHGSKDFHILLNF